MNSSLTVCLAGNPNCGKTTVFNNLTGSQQRVGNWPGVTVERKSGWFTQADTQIELIDLPGTYSLVMASDTASVDERIACDYIMNGHANVVVNILDASHLERNLYLTLQLREMQIPMVVVLNMMDVARQQNLTISVEKLEKLLGCPVVAIEAHKKKGFDTLKQAIISSSVKTENVISYSSEIDAAISQLTACLPSDSRWLATRLLEGDVFAQQTITPDIQMQVTAVQQQIQQTCGEEADIVLADARYRFIRHILAECLIQPTEIKTTWTTHLDKILLNRVLGIPIFLGIMYAMFLFSINIGGAFQDFFDIASSTFFVDGLTQVLQNFHAPNWSIALLANGVGKGINTTVTFIPVIGAMFLFLSFLEDSGYMARAAFVVDRGMRALGLPGKSFVPMIVGFGCNVPAVMGARTLDNQRDRILTVMMTPFMSCGARLAIFAVFTAAFFPVGGQNVVFALYITGILMAMLTGLLLRKTVLQGEPSPLVLELPSYHMPHLKTVGLHAWQRLKSFVFRAGKLIVPICMLIGMLSALNVDGSIDSGDGNTQSLLSAVGRFLTPIFSPMGIHQDNWPATVGLATGVLAKEVVIGTLNALYSQVGHIADLQASGFHFWGGLHDAVMSIPQNLSQLGQSFSNPILAQAPVHTLSQSVYGLMYQRFDGQAGAIAYLLFVLLYFPCVSTTAAMLRELNRGWTIFSVIWTTGVAYAVAVVFYQAATVMRHPVSSLAWIVSLISLTCLTVWYTKRFSVRKLKGAAYESC